MTDHPARWWHQTTKDTIHCDLCPRACDLKPGARGFCFVRKATEKELALHRRAEWSFYLSGWSLVARDLLH